MIKEELVKTMSVLISEIKKEKTSEYKEGYVDGILDFFSATEKKIVIDDKK